MSTIDDVLATATDALDLAKGVAGIVDRVVDRVAPSAAKHPREPRVGDHVIYYEASPGLAPPCPATVLSVPGGATVELAVTMRKNALSHECVVLFRSAPIKPARAHGSWSWL